MQYRIESIEPGEGDNDVIVTVAYWHGEMRGKPDFVEDHEICNVPEPHAYPKRNYLGQYYSKVTGELASEWVLTDDGEWVPRTPDPDEVVFEDAPPDLDGPITQPLQRRALEVAARKQRGEDRFPADRRPGRGKPAGVGLAGRPVARGLVGRVKRVD